MNACELCLISGAAGGATAAGAPGTAAAAATGVPATGAGEAATSAGGGGGGGRPPPPTLAEGGRGRGRADRLVDPDGKVVLVGGVGEVPRPGYHPRRADLIRPDRGIQRR